LVEAGANTHDACVDGREEEKKRFEEGGTAACGTIQDNIGGKLFKGFESFQSHGDRVGIFMERLRKFAEPDSARRLRRKGKGA
jgi:hypothetical protein